MVPSLAAGTRVTRRWPSSTQASRAASGMSVQPVDDMERMSGRPTGWIWRSVGYYISRARVAPDPETRRIWEHNEAEAAIADARAYLARVEVDNRRLKREAKEKEDTAKFEAAKKGRRQTETARSVRGSGGLDDDARRQNINADEGQERGGGDARGFDAHLVLHQEAGAAARGLHANASRQRVPHSCTHTGR